MGCEYKLSVKSPDEASLRDALRHFPGIRELEPLHYEVRDPPSRDGMPDASLNVMADGIYLCCYGDRRRLLGILVEKMTTHFGSVVVEEL